MTTDITTSKKISYQNNILLSQTQYKIPVNIHIQTLIDGYLALLNPMSTPSIFVVNQNTYDLLMEFNHSKSVKNISDDETLIISNLIKANILIPDAMDENFETARYFFNSYMLVTCNKQMFFKL